MSENIRLISIVIPARNEESFLPDCLSSLKNQDYPGSYEIIVADNGSTDNTSRIAGDFAVKVVRCAEEKGVGYARQAGADNARGEIIVQADADTVYPRGWLSRIAGQFAAHPEAIAVAGKFMYRDKWFWAEAEYGLRYAANKLTSALFGRPFIVSGATFAFRRNAFVAVGGYRGLSYSADQYGISSRLSKMGKIIYDSKLYVLTSARRVQKSIFTVLRDMVVNLSVWASYCARCRLNTLPQFMIKSQRRRVVTTLIPILLVAIILISYGYFIPASPIFGKVYFKGAATSNMVALTFDDGPNDPYTSQILDTLDNYDVKATFFLIGKNVELYPETAKRILADGSVVGNHSYSHDANHALTMYGSRDLDIAENVIFKELGVLPHLYRPPHGKKTPWELHNVKQQGMVEVTWNDSVNELRAKSAEQLAKDVISKVRPGSIILLHDGYGTLHNSPRADKSITAKALPIIIYELLAKGYSFVTVPQLLNVPAYNN